jgi:dinuclear metal center YbgI/SA1388 family protein
MTTHELSVIIDAFAPVSLQEKWDNAGLLIDNDNASISGVLLCLDVTEKVLEEAIQKKCNFILAHHPLIFKALKKITQNTYVERCVRKAIQHNIAIYAAHTNMDVVMNGVSGMMCKKLGAMDAEVLMPVDNQLVKFVTYVPYEFADKVKEALFAIGAGHVGNYDSCSFSSSGTGTFRGNEFSSPFVGEATILHAEQEYRIEMLLPARLIQQAEKALRCVHPYEEPAYDIIPLLNKDFSTGLGMLATLPEPMSEVDFLHLLKDVFGSKIVRSSTLTNKKIHKIAVCGGSGSAFIQQAISKHADAYVTADVSYHDFFLPENRLLLVDIGHFESEQFIKDVFFDLISKKMPTFAIHFSENEQNPVLYF